MMMYAVKRYLGGDLIGSIELETVAGVKEYISQPSLCRVDMMIVIDWPVRFSGHILTMTDFKANGECCVAFAERFEG